MIWWILAILYWLIGLAVVLGTYMARYGFLYLSDVLKAPFAALVWPFAVALWWGDWLHHNDFRVWEKKK